MNNGFSLSELLIVIAILVVIAVFGVPATITHYQNYLLIAERDSLLSYLRRARTFSLANRNSEPHGIFIESNQYVLFEGKSFTERQAAYDEVFPKAKSIQIAGTSEIVFASLAATSTGGTITLSVAPNNSFNIQINEAGGIIW